MKHGLGFCAFLLWLCLLATATTLLAQSTSNAQKRESRMETAAADPFLQKFMGEWSGKGTSFGMSADITLRAEPNVQMQFMKLQYRLEMRPQSGSAQVFEGEAVYKPLPDKMLTDASGLVTSAPKRYKGIWYDSQGAIHPISASIDAGALVAIWGEPTTTMGKTIYRFSDSTHIEITDYLFKSDGSWREFSRNTIQRTTPKN